MGIPRIFCNMTDAFSIEIWSRSGLTGLTAEIRLASAKDFVAVVRREPGEPFMIELAAPPQGARVWDLPCEAFIDAVGAAMTKLGGAR